MKIGVISNFYPPYEKGGAELVAQRTADELYRRGHDVFVLSTKEFDGLASLNPKITEYHIERIYRFYPMNLYHLLNSRKVPLPFRLVWHIIDLFSPFPASVLKKVVIAEEPDLIITHNLKGIGMQIASKIQSMGIHHIHTVHDVQLSVPSGLILHGHENSWLSKSFLQKTYERCMKKAIGIPNIVVSPSNFLADYYSERGFFKETDLKVIPNPAPRIDHFLRVERRDGPVRFLFVGQIEKHKGIQLLLESLEDVKFNFELHIAGEGSLSEYVTNWARTDKRVLYHGFISLDNINELMADSDAVILPSLCYENSPTVIYESLQIGTPVIASKIGGIPELIDHGKNGLLIDAKNRHALVAAMVEIAQKKEWYWDRTPEIRKNAKQHSLKKYVDQIEALF